MMRPGTHLRRHGFTLVELVIVILLLGILSVYASTRLFPDYTARQASEELVQAIRHAQERAMDQGGGTEVVIESDGIRFTGMTVSGAEWRLLKPGQSIEASLSPTGSVGFDAMGRPTCSGALACADAAQAITVQARGQTETVTLEPITGYVYR